MTGKAIRLYVLLPVVIFLLHGSGYSVGADVIYTTWEDDESGIWVRIQNDTEHTIYLKSILFVFYDGKGKPVGQKKVECDDQCRLSARDTKDFGPCPMPEEAVSSKVANVKYFVE